MTIAPSLFRHVMGHFATGVTVVTSALDGQLTGMTVSAFASLSLEPPLVLVCLHHEAQSHELIARAGLFAVNILDEDQEYVSRRFASSSAEKFITGAYRISEHGLPLLAGVLAVLECRLVNTLPGGDHTIFVGEPLDAQVHKSKPLLYYRSGYHQLS
jgi:flavin reductase (DIM6/NTAB) family NADH-FMN oxidoreductase RutF